MKNESWKDVWYKFLAMAIIMPIYLISRIFGYENTHRLGTKILKKAEEIEERVKK